jgi:hypothetical protein
MDTEDYAFHLELVVHTHFRTALDAVCSPLSVIYETVIYYFHFRDSVNSEVDLDYLHNLKIGKP